VICNEISDYKIQLLKYSYARILLWNRYILKMCEQLSNQLYTIVKTKKTILARFGALLFAIIVQNNQSCEKRATLKASQGEKMWNENWKMAVMEKNSTMMICMMPSPGGHINSSE